MEDKKPKLSEAALQARRAYQNKYRKENADKVREWNKNYWERKARNAQAGDNKNVL